MATKIIDRDRIQKALDDLETQNALLTNCTQLWRTLSNHFSSLEESILQKSKALNSKFETLDSVTKKTVEALEQRGNSIFESESVVIARVEEQKQAAFLEFEKAVTENVELPEALRSYCRKMDSSGLLRFMVAKRKESVTLRSQISLAIAESVDPPRLVLDAVEKFVSQKSAKVGVPDRRWACGTLLSALFPSTDSVAVAGSLAERAAAVAESWKEKMDDEEGGGVGPVEAAMFLQMVVGFGLRSRFEDEFLWKLVMEYPSRRDMPKLTAALGFGEKMGDIIDALVKSGKEIEAVYFAYEAGLTERFPPVSLLKTYLGNSRKRANAISTNGHHNATATEDASALELNSLKTIIKCVEDHKLESEFTLESVRKRVTQLEKAKIDRKKSVAAANKRARGGSGGPAAFRPAKAGRVSNTYPSFGPRNPTPAHQNQGARYSGSYNYPSHSFYEGPTSTSYASSYAGVHNQTPSGLQHYSFPPEDMVAAAAQGSGSYVTQTSYGAYDYNTLAPATYQPSYPQ